jgi:hypothetical protein
MQFVVPAIVKMVAQNFFLILFKKNTIYYENSDSLV